MTHYAVGDIQGCLAPLQCLLAQVNFNPANDVLWCAGDLINRGPQSLETLRFIKGLANSAKVVLGNHDLHLLAVAYTGSATKKSDTLQSILQADDKDELLGWLKAQPLIQQATINYKHYTMTHAGIAPCFTTANIAHIAHEVQQCLIGDNYLSFFQQMYGNEPAVWNDNLQGIERLRFITNAFTRMRYINTQSNSLDMHEKRSPHTAESQHLKPWFKQLNDSWHSSEQHILFGHWASLEGKCPNANIHALDTGCVWGGKLSLLRLEDQQLFQCDCNNNNTPKGKAAA